MEIYGTSVTDKLDRGRGLLQRRYFRQHCTMDYSGYTKDLSSIHSDLSSIFILDNSPAAYRNYTRKLLTAMSQPMLRLENAIPIKSWFSDPTDTCLLNILPFLDALRFTSDVRSILSRNQHRHGVGSTHATYFRNLLCLVKSRLKRISISSTRSCHNSMGSIYLSAFHRARLLCWIAHFLHVVGTRVIAGLHFVGANEDQTKPALWLISLVSRVSMPFLLLLVRSSA